MGGEKLDAAKEIQEHLKSKGIECDRDNSEWIVFLGELFGDLVKNNNELATRVFYCELACIFALIISVLALAFK